MGWLGLESSFPTASEPSSKGLSWFEGCSVCPRLQHILVSGELRVLLLSKAWGPSVWAFWGPTTACAAEMLPAGRGELICKRDV